MTEARRSEIPLIDISPLVEPRAPGEVDPAVAGAIDRACREVGFFVVTGHGVDPGVLGRLERAAREFFALDDAEKAAISMDRGGRAWRGWFPLGGELTSGRPDAKEGLYFGAELGPDDRRVRDGLPLHGPNLFPARPPELRPAVLAAIDQLTLVGHLLCAAIGAGLGLGPDWCRRHLTADPTVLLRVFRYAPVADGATERWGVGEHTDYGLLTLLHQDDAGGLEVHVDDRWVEVPPTPGALVCNLGDMLDRMTGGRYRATPHRVRPPRERERISIPFFFDPSWDAEVRELPLDGPVPSGARARWDHTDLRELDGSYGDHLVGKVSKVFPRLVDDVL